MNEMTKNTQVIRTQEDEKTIFGFWVYLMTDCILFASLFATYAVLRGNVYGGPSGKQLFDAQFVLAETLILLTSSFMCGLGMLCVYKKNRMGTLAFFGITFLLGISFLGMELTEFSHLIATGDSFQRSAFLSSFFTLVGTHGLHISVGLIWMLVLMIRLFFKGFTPASIKRFTLLSLFWHFLDIVWIFIFTIVYMLGLL